MTRMQIHLLCARAVTNRLSNVATLKKIYKLAALVTETNQLILCYEWH